MTQITARRGLADLSARSQRIAARGLQCTRADPCPFDGIQQLGTHPNVSPGADPWRNDLPACRLYPESARIRRHVEGPLTGLLRLARDGDAATREAVLVDCIDSIAGLVDARQHHASRPLVGVLESFDPGRVIEALASGADGVIALNDPPDVWRECLHVVLGGGRWLGGPGIEVSLHDRHASYDVARSERHAGDVTERTQMFVRNRTGDKVRG